MDAGRARPSSTPPAQRIRAEGLTPETAENLYFRAHDLKGLGATYGYPLVTRIAGSLCG